MKTKEPKDAVLLSARIAKAYPSLSAYSAATLAEQLCAIERMQSRHAVKVVNGDFRHEHDDAEERSERSIEGKVAAWVGTLQSLLLSARQRVGLKDLPPSCLLGVVEGGFRFTLDDEPGAASLKVRLPGESEAIAV